MLSFRLARLLGWGLGRATNEGSERRHRSGEASLTRSQRQGGLDLGARDRSATRRMVRSPLKPKGAGDNCHPAPGDLCDVRVWWRRTPYASLHDEGDGSGGLPNPDSYRARADLHRGTPSRRGTRHRVPHPHTRVALRGPRRRCAVDRRRCLLRLDSSTQPSVNLSAHHGGVASVGRPPLTNRTRYRGSGGPERPAIRGSSAPPSDRALLYGHGRRCGAGSLRVGCRSTCAPHRSLFSPGIKGGAGHPLARARPSSEPLPSAACTKRVAWSRSLQSPGLTTSVPARGCQDTGPTTRLSPA
jgi:hypothetical protein